MISEVRSNLDDSVNVYAADSLEPRAAIVVPSLFFCDGILLMSN